tara:strand:+ start:206 stop:667 length:462 start_codon:yes stop_codon:yes gene_type:complete
MDNKTPLTPKKRGRKPINIDLDRVEYLASLNMGIMDICKSLGVGWDTFNKHRNKKNSELSERLAIGKSKGLERATAKLMDKINDGEFNAIQFYLKSADRERWAEKIETKVNINLNEIINQGKGRLIEGEKVEEGLLKERFLCQEDAEIKDNDK